ncbi:kinesin-like protein KIF15 [Mya arenaria]|uniref:kinesin-like protein KIF15 n=1 Tax=Mya arenaria TaxID=6604 RepID=UPI0022E7E2E8|nr:kinesin-like protein KIF15 [Mya arenaria]
MFKATLEKDYKWLADKLDKELSNLQSDKNSFPKRVSQIIKMQLDPLVHGFGEGTTFDENSPDDIAKTLGKTLRTLDVRCHQALNEPIRTPRRPLHVMIKGKMIQAEHLKVQPTPRGDNHTKEQDNLKTKNRELKKQVQELAKVKTENEKLADRVKKQRERLQECSKATRETKKLQEELERCKRENEQLKGKVDTLQEQFYT